MKKYPSLTKTEAYAIWGYTTRFFYWDLNLAIRNGEKLAELADLKSILNRAISKMPKYDGIAYRAIELKGEIYFDTIAKSAIDISAARGDGELMRDCNGGSR